MAVKISKEGVRRLEEKGSLDKRSYVKGLTVRSEPFVVIEPFHKVHNFS